MILMDPCHFESAVPTEKRETAMKNILMMMSALCLVAAHAPSEAYAQAADTLATNPTSTDTAASVSDGVVLGGVVSGGPATSLGNHDSKIQILQTRIASLEKRIAALEAQSKNTSGQSTDACKQVVESSNPCLQTAAATTTSRVVVRRYLIPLSTNVVPMVSAPAEPAVQPLAANGVLSSVPILAAPNAVTMLGAPVSTVTPRATVTTVVPGAVTTGTNYSTWGAYPTTVYRGVGAVYSNSYSAAALSTGSGVSYIRIR